MNERAGWAPSPPGGVYREAEQLLPLALGLAGWCLLLAAIGVSSGVVLAMRGPSELAAFGLAGSLAAAAWVLGGSAVLAAVPRLTLAMSGSLTDRLAVRGIWRQALQIALVACGVSLVLALLAPLLTNLAGRGLPAGVGRAAVWWCLGVLPGLLALACAVTLRAIGQTPVVVLSGVLGFVLNLALMLLLAVGDMGANGLGSVVQSVVRTLAYPLAGSGPLPVVLMAAVSAAVTATVMLLVLWGALATVPRRNGFGWTTQSLPEPLADRFADVHRDVLPALALPVPTVLLVTGLVWLAAGLPDPSLAALAGLGVLVAPLVAVGWGFALAASQRVMAVRREGQMRPGAVSRCGQRCSRLALAGMALVCLLHAVAPRDLVQALYGRRELGDMVLQLLLLGIGVAVLDGLAVLHAATLNGLDRGRQALQVQLGGAVLALVLAAVAGRVLQGGLYGMLVAVALVAAARVWMLSSRFNLAAEGADGAAADAVRKRANAIAHGWADTVMMWPAEAEEADAAVASQRSRGRGRRPSSVR